MSVFEGYVFEIERSYQTENNYHKIRNIYWFDSFKNKTINNDGSMLLISEPVINFESVNIEEYKNNYYLKYEDKKWILCKNL